MGKISAVIIARNEEKMIGEALESVSFCDEIILIDNGSKDKTKEIAEGKEAKVYEIKTTDFSELRNLGKEKAGGEWILYVDADERVDENLKESIKRIISEEPNYSAFLLQRKNFYLGNHQWPQIEKLERLFRKDKLQGWKGELHESPIIEGETGLINKGFLLHFTHRSLESMLNKTIEWSTVEAVLRYNSGHPKMTWWRFPRVMISAFLNSYLRQGGYRVGVAGVIESIYQAFSAFVTYAKLWELQLKTQSLKNKT
jgi:glycosyltransferase involved in cell wall biosynthesis